MLKSRTGRIVDFIPGLDSYSFHLHADAWEALPELPWGIEKIARQATELDLRALQSADMKHFEKYRDENGKWKVSALDDFLEITRSAGLELEIGTGGWDIEHLRSVIRLADICGAGVIRTFLGGGLFAGKKETARRLAEAGDAFRKLAGDLDAAGVVLAMENHQDLDAETLLEFLDKLGLERVGVCLDTGNPLGVLEDPLHAAEVLASRTFSVHVKDYHVLSAPEADGYFLVGAVPGSGAVPLHEIFTILKKESPREQLCLQLECAVEYIPVTNVRKGWRADFGARAENLLTGLLNVNTEAARAAAAKLDGIKQEADTNAALEFEENQVRAGAEALRKIVADRRSS